MARVFAKPTYTTSVGKGDAITATIAKVMTADTSKYATAARIADDDHTFNDIVNAIDKDGVCSLHDAIVSRIARDACGGIATKVLRGAPAVCTIFKHVCAHGVDRDPVGAWDDVERAGRAAATVGAVAGWASGGPAADAIAATRISSVMAWDGCRAVDLIALSDEFRLGFACPSAKAAYERARADAARPSWAYNPDAFRVDATRGGRILALRGTMAVGKSIIVRIGRAVCVVDSTHRSNLASCLYSLGMWPIAGASTRAATVALEYVRSALAATASTTTWELARYLKSEYAVMLCNAQVGYDPDLFAAQRAGLDEECASYAHFDETQRFSSVMGSSDDAINFGTVWNILPPADISPSDLASAFAAKCSSIKPADDDAWDDFIAYASMVVSAHYILAHRTAVVVWHHAGDADPTWAAKCREGVLTYARDGTYDWIHGSIPWVRLIENWAYDAQDVTHVHADPECTVDNELTYALEHGPNLSIRTTPADVRNAWCAGALPGVRNLYMAGKSENTKFGSKVRETMSGDDIMRECLSEIDKNMTTIGHVIHGVTMRRGRSSVERMINDVLKHGSASRVLLSLDVSGWSPNMIRRKEMAFVDRLMSMFNIPPAMTASCVFKDLTVHCRRGDFATSFAMVDGSVQGFFGTADTIMHSIMAQWAFRNVRDAGIFAPGSKIDKVVLIDDIMCCLDGIGASPAAAVNAFTAEYRRLGFSVDTVKTLAASNIATFLNRVYTPTGEIVTWAKIAAKADREWDRPVIGIADEVSSVFGGFAGAVDRGMPIARAYTIACFRAISRVAALMGSGWVASEGLYHISLLAPSAWGGLGVPSITEWITGGAAGAAPSRLAAMGTVARQAAAGEYARARSMVSTVYALAGRDVHVRAPHAAFSAPCAVRPACVKTADGGIAAAVRSAIKAKFPKSMFARFYTLTAGKDVDDKCSLFMSEGVFDGPVAESLWSCTPYAVADSAIARFAASSEGLRWVKRRTLIATLRMVRKADRDNLTMHALIADGSQGPSSIDGSAILRDMIAREGVCHGMSNVISPAPADFLGYAPGAPTAHIRAFIPASNDVYARSKATPASRTFASAVARVGLPALEAAGNPVVKAFATLVKTASVAESVSSAGSIAYTFVASMWGTQIDEPLYYPIHADNPFRVLTTYCAPSHSVRACPNYAGSISVSYNGGLREFRQVNKNFDWATAKAFVMGACLVDASLGLARLIGGTLERTYVVRNVARVTRSRTAPCAIDASSAACAPAVRLGDAYGANFCAMLVDAGAEVDDVEGVASMARIAFTAGVIRDQRSTARPMDVGGLMAALRSTAPAPDRTDDQADVPAATPAAAAGVSSSVRELCALYRSGRMTRDQFAAHAADNCRAAGAELSATPTGRAIWKSVAGRNAEKCHRAMAVLCSIADQVGSPDAMKAWREACGVRYASISENSTVAARTRYMYHFASFVSRALARSSPSHSGAAYTIMCHAMADARNSIGRRGGVADIIPDVGGTHAADRKRTLLASLAIDGVLAAADDIAPAAADAWDKAYDWVIADYVAPEMQTARVDAAAAAASAAPTADANLVALAGMFAPGGAGLGADFFANMFGPGGGDADDDADAAPGGDADVPDGA